MRDQFSRLLEDSDLVPNTNSGGAGNFFSENMELVKVSEADDLYNFGRFYACYKMTLLTYFKLFSGFSEVKKLLTTKLRPVLLVFFRLLLKC